MTTMLPSFIVNLEHENLNAKTFQTLDKCLVLSKTMAPRFHLY